MANMAWVLSQECDATNRGVGGARLGGSWGHRMSTAWVLSLRVLTGARGSPAPRVVGAAGGGDDATFFIFRDENFVQEYIEI